MKKSILYGLIVFILSACGFDDSPQLPSVEDREAVAISDLSSMLLAPANGWRIDYRPTDGTGSVFVLLDFNEDGTVRVQSDVAANDGQFRDQTITYRIDNAQGLELILETYAVFHYIFELDQATFGGEFEFLFVEEQGGDLIFESKTDAQIGQAPTRLTYENAAASDADLISIEAFAQLGQGIFQTENLANAGIFATYNLYVEGNDHTISTTFDLDRRVMKFHGIAQGQTVTEIITNNNGNSIDVTIPFGIRSDVIILDQPVTTSLGGVNYSIGEIPLENFNKFVDSFCAGQQDSIASFNSDGVSGLGDITISSSLFQTHSTFQSGPNEVFSVNHIFIFNENDSSISADIEAVFPDVVNFQWYYGTDIGEVQPLTAVGFVTVDASNNAEFYLRRFDFVQDGNRIQLTFTGENFITDDNVTPEQITGLEALTDEIFSGGEVFMLEVITIDGLYEFYNPCNKYKGFIL